MNFKIEKRDGLDLVVHPDGWTRPASADEAAMGARIAELEKALRDIADPQSFHTIQEMRAIASTALMER